MKLYTAELTPSTFRVEAFLHEKGVDVPRQLVRVVEGETRTPQFRAINTLGEVPVLELDDGTIITETLAICRYFDEMNPQKPLMGRDPVEKAKIEMWSRRMEQQMLRPLADRVLHSHPFFADKVEQLPAYAESQERLARRKWQWLDAELSDGRTFVCDDRFSVADVTGMAALVIMQLFGLAIPEGLENAGRWKAAVEARPSMTRLVPESVAEAAHA